MRVAAVYSVAAFTVVCGAVQNQATASFAVPIETTFVFILLAWMAGPLHFFPNLSQLPIRTMIFLMLFTTFTCLKLQYLVKLAQLIEVKGSWRIL